ncbi:DUF5317 domain-containing protein [Candidatus Wolfebacteria bacterium]|nr:DUF5317 domain-containing protein [Candidatus Wolfebacteria bacterium]
MEWLDRLIGVVIPTYLLILGVIFRYIIYFSSDIEKENFWLKFSPLIILFFYGLFIDLFMTSFIRLTILTIFSLLILVANYKELGLFIYSVGSLLNCVAMLANDYKMPALTQLGETRVLKPLTDITVFPLLCDLIKTPGLLVISIGDIILTIGCLIFLFTTIKKLIKVINKK